MTTFTPRQQQIVGDIHSLISQIDAGIQNIGAGIERIATPKPRPDDDEGEDLRARHRRLRGAMRRAFKAPDKATADRIISRAERKDRRKPGPRHAA